jgi:hypothetical protein
MNAIGAIQVIRREDQHGHYSAVLDRIHLPNHRFSYFKPLAIDMDICSAGSEAWNQTIPHPIALLTTHTTFAH